MPTIKLDNRQNTDITIITNEFIDEYMFEANGEFVKIYVYLLRCVHSVPEAFSISSIADKINLTEKDVVRALKYWEKLRLLSLDTDDNNQICTISLADYKRAANDVSENMIKKEAVAPISKIPKSPEIDAYTPADFAKLKSDSAVIEALFITERYLGRTLNPSENLRIYYFYDVLEFSTDLIDYLVEYCVSNQKKSMRYIEKVALSWAEKGIKTVTQAKQELSNYHKDYFTILKAFGIRNRNPVNTEITYMNKWLNNYQFTIDIIEEACSRTIQHTGVSNFPYADSILTAWKEKGIVMKKDIRVLDETYKRKQEAQKEIAAAKTNSKSPNRFKNFNERDTNYSEFEKQLYQM